MRRLLKSLAIIICGMIFTVAGGIGGYYIAFNGEKGSDYDTGLVMAEAKQGNVIGEKTVMEFVYNYSDGFSETQQSLPQQFMYGWDREKTQQAYSEWVMSEFSADRIVFNKNVEGESPQHYILKEKDGYVAVYYRDTGILKEMTSAPVSALGNEDKELFKEGVLIDGDANLIKYIEGLET